MNCKHELTGYDGAPYSKGLGDYMATICESCGHESETELRAGEPELYRALDLILDELTDRNAHTLAAMLEAYYRTGYDMDKVERAYKAAQWELFGTR